MRCEWCGITTHSTCRSRVPEECGFGTLRDIIIPPYAISIPRIADLNKDLILGIGNNMSKPIQNTSNNNSIPQTSDYVIVGSSSTTDSKNAGLIMRSSSTEHPSGGDLEAGPASTEKEPRSRAAETYASGNVQMENMTIQSGKPKHVKPSNKNQQDEEEER
ncbi:unnamed protein product, partial [Rotaria socialis]